MPFIQTIDGNFINTDHIRQARNGSRSGQATVTLFDDEGATYVTERSTWDHFLSAHFLSVVPAQPGTVFLTPVQEEDGRTTWCHDPVIAWGITASGRPEPLDHDGVDDMNRAVMFPTGQIRSAFGSWETFDEYLAQRAALGMER